MKYCKVKIQEDVRNFKIDEVQPLEDFEEEEEILYEDFFNGEDADVIDRVEIRNFLQ